MNLFKRNKKPLVVTVHGFGKNRSSEMDGLCTFLQAHGYETMQFDIYDLDNGLDADPKEWIRRCERKMQEAFSINRRVILAGFSMGGVIASYLATVYRVEKLILVAPAFRYLDFEKIAKSVSKTVTGRKGDEVPSSAQTKAFRDVVALCKDSIGRVECPVLILHGTEDEVIDPSTSHEAYKKIPHNRKRLLFLEGGRHRLLYDGRLEDTADRLILDFMNGKLMKTE